MGLPLTPKEFARKTKILCDAAKVRGRWMTGKWENHSNSKSYLKDPSLICVGIKCEGARDGARHQKNKFVRTTMRLK